MIKIYGSSNSFPANIRLGEYVLKTSWRSLEDVFSVTFFCRLQNFFKTSRHNCKTSSSFLKTFSEDLLQLHLEDVFEDEKLLRWRRHGKQEMFVGLLFLEATCRNWPRFLKIKKCFLHYCMGKEFQCSLSMIILRRKDCQFLKQILEWARYYSKYLFVFRILSDFYFSDLNKYDSKPKSLLLFNR